MFIIFILPKQRVGKCPERLKWMESYGDLRWRNCQKIKRARLEQCHESDFDKFWINLLPLGHVTSHSVKLNYQKTNIDLYNNLIALELFIAFLLSLHIREAIVRQASLMGSATPAGISEFRPRLASNGHGRIVSAAVEVLRSEPENFNVQRVARQAGLSARAIYGHFASGAELERTAKLSMLRELAESLPDGVDHAINPGNAIRNFALEVAASFQDKGSTWLALSCQDDAFRTQYRNLVRLPLIRAVECHLILCAHGPVDAAKLAEVLIVAIESVAVGFDDGLALNIDRTEAIAKLVDAFWNAVGT